LVDVVDEMTRSRMMKGIRSEDTKPEIVVRKALFAAGLRFRLHRRDLPGIPDIVLSRQKVAIFVHGCFWHVHAGCKNARLPSTRQAFWHQKLGRNVERDKESVAALLAMGWRVMIIWECATKGKKASDNLPVLLSSWIEGGDSYREFPPSGAVT